MTDQTPVLLITRPDPEAGELADHVRAACTLEFEVLLSPLIAIETVCADVRLEDFDGVIFTSVNGARRAAHLDHPKGQRAYCVGDRTADAARIAGFDAVSARGAAPDLIAMILSDPATGPLVHLRGAAARGKIAENLCKAGRDVRSVVVYQQRPLPLSPLALDVLVNGRPVVAPLFSPKTAESLMKKAPSGANLQVIAMSEAVADMVRKLRPCRVCIAERPDLPAMVAAICAALGGNSGRSGP